jgi:hypothetical protein
LKFKSAGRTAKCSTRPLHDPLGGAHAAAGRRLIETITH